MKKFAIILFAVVLCLAMIGCGTTKAESPAPAESTESPAAEAASEEVASEAESADSEAAEEPEIGTGVYTVYNKTGETVTEMYLFETGAEDKGENLAGEGFAADENVELTFEAATDAALTLSFVTEGGYEAAFETLHIEEAPITLLSVDAMTGATPIAFQAAE